MPKYMPYELRTKLVEVAESVGYAPLLKDDGNDRYVKNITLSAGAALSPVYIGKVTGNFGLDGRPVWFQVAVHPEVFDERLVSRERGIEAMYNRRTKANRFASSNYRGFPYGDGTAEPYGKCYRAFGLDAFETLLLGLRSERGNQVGIDEGRKPEQPDAEPPVLQTGVAVSAQRRYVARSRVPTTGLIIGEPYVTQILDGEKTWEMRCFEPDRRGPIALIAKGTGKVVGVADLVDVLPSQSEANMRATVERHRIPLDKLAEPGVSRWRTPWVLDAAFRLPQPVSYKHPSGAVIWVNLAEEVVSALGAQLPDDR